MVVAEQDTSRGGDVHTVGNDPHPARPQNRLDFNDCNGSKLAHAVVEAFPSNAPVSLTPSSTSQPSPASRSQAQGDEGSALRRSLHEPPVEDVGANPGTPRTVPKTFESPYAQSSDDNGDINIKLAAPKPPTSQRSVSRLCFPFVTTSPRRQKAPLTPPPRPPPRHKYSCQPTLLSPYGQAGRSSPAKQTRQRHEYADRGYSRIALQEVKWFWLMREEHHRSELPQSHQPHLHEPRPISGYTPIVSPVSLERGLVSSPPPPDLPQTIHPRCGDMRTLRDPYNVHIDHFFADIPMWTLSKMQWMLDMHKLVGRNDCRKGMMADEDPSDCESDFEASISTGFSEDSDATLVESESETDLTALGRQPPISPTMAFLQASQPGDGKCFLASNQATIRSRKGQLSPLLSILPSAKKQHWPIAVYHHGCPATALSYQAPLPSNWVHRWDVLLDLSRPEWPPAPSTPRKAAFNPSFFVPHSTYLDDGDSWN